MQAGQPSVYPLPSTAQDAAQYFTLKSLANGPRLLSDFVEFQDDLYKGFLAELSDSPDLAGATEVQIVIKQRAVPEPLYCFIVYRGHLCHTYTPYHMGVMSSQLTLTQAIAIGIPGWLEQQSWQRQHEETMRIQGFGPSAWVTACRSAKEREGSRNAE